MQSISRFGGSALGVLGGSTLELLEEYLKVESWLELFVKEPFVEELEANKQKELT